jgi:hypothetical protein
VRVGRRAAVIVTVDLYGGSAAAVALRPALRRWPAQETRDRLDVAIAFMAATLLRTEQALAPRIRHQAMILASSLVEAPAPSVAGADAWAEQVAGRRLVGPRSPGEPRIQARLIPARRGSWVEVLGPRPTTLALSASAAAVAAVALRDADRDVRLAAALAMEGLLQWCGDATKRRLGAERALCEAYGYAARRLAGTRVPPPEALRSAVSTDGGRAR